MLFNSPVFLFLFLPLILGIYYLAPKRFRNLILLFASLFFYTWGEKELVIIILASTCIDFIAGLLIARGYRKMGLYLSILFNLGILLIFKYLNFAVNNLQIVSEQFQLGHSFYDNYTEIILPLGISFYTFQTMSYTIDVYRGKVTATRNFIDFATYVTLFPQLIAGPIIKYKDVATQLTARKTSTYLFSEGIKRFIIGLAKKMLIANQCAFLADGIFNMPETALTTPLAWLGVIAYSLQIYYDFSGYSDMAIGLGKLFGFNFLENFNFPYIARSIREFWQRWHISLSNWFKEYVYFSLGGNRGSNLMTYRNLIIVFFITGLWHGASWTFIVWGMLHGLFIIIERIGLKKWLIRNKLFAHCYTIFALLITWPFFRCNSIAEAFFYFKKMFAFDFRATEDFYNYYLTTEVLFFMILGILFSTRLIPILKDRLGTQKRLYTHVLKSCILLVLFIISCMYIAIDAYDPFIYFRF